jgi:hypothetical protein
MTSLPGVLTAVAGLVTAVTGGGLYLSSDNGPEGGGGGTVVITMAADPVPQESAQVDVGDLDAGLSAESGDDEVTTLFDGCIAGDYDACDTLFYQLADECSLGYGLSCDVLWEISASGSDFEEYGATCGGRVEDWTYAGACADSGL